MDLALLKMFCKTIILLNGIVLFSTTLPFCFHCLTLTSVYYYQKLPLNSWNIQNSFPSTESEYQCFDQFIQEHSLDNCGSQMLYDKTSKVCEIGTKADTVDWTHTNYGRVSSRIPPVDIGLLKLINIKYSSTLACHGQYKGVSELFQ